MQAVGAEGRSSNELEKAAAMFPEDFDDFVVFGIRAVNEVLREAAGGLSRNEGGLKEGLEFEVELNGMSDPEIFARASAMVPALSKEVRLGDAPPRGVRPPASRTEHD